MWMVGTLLAEQHDVRVGMMADSGDAQRLRAHPLRCGLRFERLLGESSSLDRRSSTPRTSPIPTSSRTRTRGVPVSSRPTEAYLGSYRPTRPHRTLTDLIAFNAEHADAEMPFFGQELFEQAAAKGPLTGPAYLEALAPCQRLSRADGIDAVMDEHRRDALVAPSNAPAWRIDFANGDPDGGGNTTPAAVRLSQSRLIHPCGHASRACQSSRSLPVGRLLTRPYLRALPPRRMFTR
jgi:hypothetical protein